MPVVCVTFLSGTCLPEQNFACFGNKAFIFFEEFQLLADMGRESKLVGHATKRFQVGNVDRCRGLQTLEFYVCFEFLVSNMKHLKIYDTHRTRCNLLRAKEIGYFSGHQTLFQRTA